MGFRKYFDKIRGTGRNVLLFGAFMGTLGMADSL